MKQCCKEYLTEQFGDEDVVNEIYTEYAKSIQEKLPEFEAALAAENWTTLDSLAHAVKGNALATGVNAVADVAISMRASAKMSDKATSQALFDKMKELTKDI